MKKIFLTGVTGQDGSYLAEQALFNGEEVHAIVRRSSSFNTARIDHLWNHPNFFKYYGDLTDVCSLSAILSKVQPDEIYNLGAQSHVRVSFDCPNYTVDTIVSGTLNLLEAYRHLCPKARFYQASSSEMFGGIDCPEKGYNEESPFNPQSPYACAKVCAHHLAKNYRKSYGLHISCGILFNHESPMRGETFVTRKISKAVARIKKGLQKSVSLGNLDAKRDWGFAPEFVDAMRLMLKQEKPADYVIATGETHSVQEFVVEAFRCVAIEDWNRYVVIDSRLFRPAEVNLLLGDPRKAQVRLGWTPKTKFKDLVRSMVLQELVDI